jgi:hypothetical protein
VLAESPTTAVCIHSGYKCVVVIPVSVILLPVAAEGPPDSGYTDLQLGVTKCSEVYRSRAQNTKLKILESPVCIIDAGNGRTRTDFEICDSPVWYRCRI